jgi:hypothetical protein
MDVETSGYLCCRRHEWSEIKTATLLMAPPIPDAEHITEDDIEKIDYAVNAPPAKAGGAFTLE